MQSWKVFPSALWSEASRTRWGTWCKVKWARAWTLGGKLHACDSLDGRARGETLDPPPAPPPPPPHPPPPSAEPMDPPGNKGRFHVFNRRWGFCSRLIDSGSLFVTALVLGSITEPAGDTFSAAAHDTDTHRAARQDSADSAVTSPQMVHNIYLRFLSWSPTSVFLTGALSSVFLGVAAVPPPALLFVRVSALEWGLGAFEDLFL